MLEVENIEKAFDNKFTRQFGFPKKRPATKVKPYMSDKEMEFVRESPFLVMATSGTDGTCDASPKGGKPGFVKVLDETRLLIPDVAGNRLFQSYLNMTDNPHVGLIFFIPGITDTVRINGKSEFVTKEELNNLEIELEVHNPDDNSKVQQGILVTVEEAYGHCPRALNFSKLWG